MVVTVAYNAGTNTLSATGAGTVHMADLVANSAGHIVQIATGVFTISCFIVIGDGSTATVLSDTGVILIFADGITVSSWQRLWDTLPGSTTQFGTLLSLTNRTVSGGCIFQFLETHYSFAFGNQGNGIAYFYGCTFMNMHTNTCGVYANHVIQAFGCSGTVWWDRIVSGGYLLEAKVLAGNYGVGGQSNVTIDSVKGFNVGAAIYNYGTGNITVKNAIFSGVNSNVCKVQADTSGTPVWDLINVQSDVWTIEWVEGANSKAQINKKYEFDLQAVDNQNNGAPVASAAVTCFDKNGNQLWTATTDANGNIATQIVTRGYFNQTNGNTLQDLSPLKLKITKEGYMDYTDEMTPTMKTQYQISMNRIVPLITTVNGDQLVDLQPRNPESYIYLKL